MTTMLRVVAAWIGGILLFACLMHGADRSAGTPRDFFVLACAAVLTLTAALWRTEKG